MLPESNNPMPEASVAVCTLGPLNTQFTSPPSVGLAVAGVNELSATVTWTLATDEKTAVYDVAPAGAVMLWVWAPPSDQDANAYVDPPELWGEGALTELLDPTMTVLENGVV